VEGLRLEFKQGATVKIQARKGQNFVVKQLSMDKGANKLGEFSLTDKRLSKIDTFMANTLFDENYGGKNGNCHVALGASYADTYDGNLQELTKEKIISEQHSTKPPARFTEASLIKELEKHGIGRPSTYSPTLSTLSKRNYTEKN